jgi:hypothetical protein
MKKNIILVALVVLVIIVVLAIMTISPKKNSIPEQGNSPKEYDVGSIMNAIKDVEFKEGPRISGNPTEEEIYNNEYIKSIRVVFNEYLAGRENIEANTKEINEKMDYGEVCGLNAFDKGYYKSRFIIISAEDNDYGGVQADIFFIDRPDKLFWAWVYKLGSGEYSLRAFCEAGPPAGKEADFAEYTKMIIESSDYSL